MSNFIIKPPHHTSIVSLEQGNPRGQVDIMASAPDGRSYRVAALVDGKLIIFRFNTVIADEIGLKLDAGHFPVINHVS